MANFDGEMDDLYDSLNKETRNAVEMTQKLAIAYVNMQLAGLLPPTC